MQSYPSELATSIGNLPGGRQDRWRSISTRPSRRDKLTPERLRWLHERESSLNRQVQALLNEYADCVAIVSRRGSDLSRYRFDTPAPRYTHTAFVVRGDSFYSGSASDTGVRWYCDHLLNTHEGGEGHLYRHPLIDFFKDDPFEYEVCVTIPSVELQRRIRSVLTRPLREELHNPNYNRLAYPFSTRFQNSNQWLMEIVGAAQSGLVTRLEIQNFLKESGLSPTIIRLGRGMQMLARMTTSNTRFGDHPDTDRANGRIHFLVEPSMRSYLEMTDDVVLTRQVWYQQTSAVRGGSPLIAA